MAKIVFPMPKEYAAPEGLGNGDEFDAVCTFRMENGGKVCLIKMGDADMPGYDDKKLSRPDYGEAAMSQEPPMQNSEGA